MYVFFLVVSTGSTTAPYGVEFSPISYPSRFSFPYTASTNSTSSPVTGSICSSPVPSSMISSESLSSCFDSFIRTGGPSKSLSANLSVTLRKSIIVKYCFPKAINNLESCISFTGSCSHYKKDSILTTGNRFYRSVYCNSLIVTGCTPLCIKEI